MQVAHEFHASIVAAWVVTHANTIAIAKLSYSKACVAIISSSGCKEMELRELALASQDLMARYCHG